MPKPTIIITGTPDWLDTVHDILSGDYTLNSLDAETPYMTTLVEARAALILVDGAAVDWERYTTTPKSSPATRRIPIVLVTDNAEQHAKAALKGADITLSPGELAKSIRKIVTDYGRIPDPAELEQLDCECQEPLPPLAVEGVKMFNKGQYYKQHDLFEEQWVNTEGPVRDLYRAVLQVGVAYYQIERGNYRGALKMLQRSVQWLLVLPDVCQGINVKKLRDDSFRVRAELERLGEARFDEFDRGLIQGVEWSQNSET